MTKALGRAVSLPPASADTAQNNPPGSGISRIFTLDQFRSRTYDFVLNGDTYPTTTNDTLLHSNTLRSRCSNSISRSR